MNETKTTELLFVGGAADGQRWPVPDHHNSADVPLHRLRQRRPPDGADTYGIHTYHRGKVQVEGELFELMKWDQLGDAEMMRALFANYRAGQAWQQVQRAHDLLEPIAAGEIGIDAPDDEQADRGRQELAGLVGVLCWVLDDANAARFGDFLHRMEMGLLARGYVLEGPLPYARKSKPGEG